MKYIFDDIVIDTASHELFCSGESLHVEPRVFHLLVYLAENPQRLIPTDELLQSVWKGRVVSDTTVAGCVKHARKAIGDDGSRQAFIKTVRGRGFRFCADVSHAEDTILKGGGAPPGSATIRETEGTPVFDSLQRSSVPNATDETLPTTTERKSVNGNEYIASALGFNPSLAIQAFQAYSETPGTKFFVHRISLALTTVLSRVPLLRLSSLRDDSNSLAPRELHEALGCDYCLSGSIEVMEDHLRVMVQLCDARTGFNLWSHQFQIPGTPDTAHDQTVQEIVARLEPQLHRAMYNTAISSSTAPSALELYLQASGLLALKGWHHQSFETASDLLRRSWQQEPGFAHASSYLSLVLGLGHRLGLMSNESRVRDEALEAAEHSLELETMDSSVMGLAGCALGDLGHGARATSILKRAVELNPSNGQAWSALGSVELSQRRVQDAITHLSQGIEMSPHDSRLSVWGGVLATALRVSGKLDEAVKHAQFACDRDDRTYMPRVILAGVYISAKESLKAQTALTDAFRIKPDLTIKQIEYLLGRRLTGVLIQAR